MNDFSSSVSIVLNVYNFVARAQNSYVLSNSRFRCEKFSELNCVWVEHFREWSIRFAAWLVENNQPNGWKTKCKPKIVIVILDFEWATSTINARTICKFADNYFAQNAKEIQTKIKFLLLAKLFSWERYHLNAKFHLKRNVSCFSLLWRR